MKKILMLTHTHSWEVAAKYLQHSTDLTTSFTSDTKNPTEKVLRMTKRRKEKLINKIEEELFPEFSPLNVPIIGIFKDIQNNKGRLSAKTCYIIKYNHVLLLPKMNIIEQHMHSIETYALNESGLAAYTEQPEKFSVFTLIPIMLESKLVDELMFRLDITEAEIYTFATLSELKKENQVILQPFRLYDLLNIK